MSPIIETTLSVRPRQQQRGPDFPGESASTAPADDRGRVGRTMRKLDDQGREKTSAISQVPKGDEQLAENDACCSWLQAARTRSSIPPRPGKVNVRGGWFRPG